MNAFKNQKGLTLVEVLAALAILGIVFIGIMTIFPQMTLFNAKTEAKQETMNLAREEIEKIVSTADRAVWAGYWNTNLNRYEEFSDKVPIVLGTKNGYSHKITNPDFDRYQRMGDEYMYEADIYRNCEPIDSDPTCNNPDKTQLYKVHLKVFNGSHLSSETYSYIKFYVEK